MHIYSTKIVLVLGEHSNFLKQNYYDFTAVQTTSSNWNKAEILFPDFPISLRLQSYAYFHILHTFSKKKMSLTAHKCNSYTFIYWLHTSKNSTTFLATGILLAIAEVRALEKRWTSLFSEIVTHANYIYKGWLNKVFKWTFFSKEL